MVSTSHLKQQRRSLCTLQSTLQSMSASQYYSNHFTQQSMHLTSGMLESSYNYN